MRARVGINLKKWALPLSVDAEAKPVRIGILCFTFGITTGHSEALRDSLILEDTAGPAKPPPLPSTTTVYEEDEYEDDEDYEDEVVGDSSDEVGA